MMDKIIDRLFKRLAATYGAEWERSMAEVPIADVRTVWAHELTPFAGSLGRIAWALDNLPQRCPNPIIFKSLCRAAPAKDETPILENNAPVDPAIRKALVAAMSNQKTVTSAKTWATALQATHEAGGKLNANQIRCYKNALSLHPQGAQL